ncbi:MAG: prephenate dehydrogenase [Planctomycetota bacterium]|nr:prephenate dehydrogenase [Planctomycetota bacterium]
MTAPLHNSQPLYETAAIVGVGLIGGSIAAALRRRGLAREVVGVGRDAGRLGSAVELQLIDRYSTSIEETARQADLMVFCTPVDRIEAGIREAAAVCRPGTLLTDAGSVKQSICHPLATGLPAGTLFVGSHPMAGGEQQGCTHASSELFVGRRCVVTPVESTPPEAVERASQLWRGIGGNVLVMSPEEHDATVARASHVPHIAAAALAAILPTQAFPVASTGFRDATRIASGDPDLWTSILLQNDTDVAAGLRELESQVAAFRAAVEQRDATALCELLRAGQNTRTLWLRVFNAPAEATDLSTTVEDTDALGS